MAISVADIGPACLDSEISGFIGAMFFANDLLGYTEGHVPRHSKAYRDFAAEHARLQGERIAAFAEFRADVESGAYPEERHLVRMSGAERARFIAGLDAERGERRG